MDSNSGTGTEVEKVECVSTWLIVGHIPRDTGTIDSEFSTST